MLLLPSTNSDDIWPGTLTFKQESACKEMHKQTDGQMLPNILSPCFAVDNEGSGTWRSMFFPLSPTLLFNAIPLVPSSWTWKCLLTSVWSFGRKVEGQSSRSAINMYFFIHFRGTQPLQQSTTTQYSRGRYTVSLVMVLLLLELIVLGLPILIISP